MFIDLILVIVSFVLIIVLISIRGFKIAYAKEGSTPLDITDKKIANLFFLFFRTYKKTTKFISNFFKDLPNKFTHFVNKISFSFYKKTRNIIKGKIDSDKERGSVSVYLQDIEKKD